MFETEIEAIRNSVRAKTIGEEDSITLRDINGAPIHPAIKAYFRAEVGKLLQAERAQEVRSKRFPYAHPSVVGLQRQIDLLLLLHYEFDQEEFDSLLDDAVHFQFNYLCRPQWTLLSFVLDNKRSVPVADLTKKLDYCIDYEYLPALIRRYVEDRGLAEITYEEFKTLLARIDQEVTGRHSSYELARMPRALFTFVEEGQILPPNQFGQPTLPINAAIVFFEDKALDDIKSRLEYERDVHKVQSLSIAELASLIEKARTRSEEAGIPVVSFAPAPEPVPQPGAEAPTEPSDRTMPAAVRIAPAPEAVRVDPSPVTPQETRVGTSATAPPSRPVSFTPAERKHFIKTVFRKDQDAFETAVEELNRIASWDEATHFIDALFVANDIDPFSREAVEFTDRVYSRFFPA